MNHCYEGVNHCEEGLNHYEEWDVALAEDHLLRGQLLLDARAEHAAHLGLVEGAQPRDGAQHRREVGDLHLDGQTQRNR